MIKKRLIFILLFLNLLMIFANAFGQDNTTDSVASTQKNMDKRINIIENHLDSLTSSFNSISNELNNTKANMETTLSSKISDTHKQVESAIEEISGLSKEFYENKKYVSSMLSKASSPDYTQIGMFWFSMILVLITVIATYIN